MPAQRRLRALAFWLGGEWVQNYEHAIDGTPCQAVEENRRVVHYADRILELYPEEPNLRKMGAVSYMGVPLIDLDGTILGQLAVMDTKPMPEEPIRLTVFEIFAARAAAELRRLRAERDVRAREAQLARLVESTMDAIVQLDGELRVTQMNPAAERTFEIPAEQAKGVPLSRLASAEDAAKLEELRGMGISVISLMRVAIVQRLPFRSSTWPNRPMAFAAFVRLSVGVTELYPFGGFLIAIVGISHLRRRRGVAQKRDVQGLGIGAGGEERVSPRYFFQLGGGAHHDRDADSQLGLERRRDARRHPAGDGIFAAEHDVAALDVRPDVGASGVGEHAGEGLHRHHVLAADVDPAQ